MTLSAHVTCSVCIANYNGIGVLEECLASVRAQDFPGTIEIIVHDDASNDGSRKYLENQPDVICIFSETNVGFCVANNRMGSIATGDYLLLLNNDAALHPGALAALLNEAVSRSVPAVLTLPQYDYTTDELVDRACFLDPFYNPVPLDRPHTEAAMVIGACLWIPVASWHALGGFPEWMGSIAEDLYLCCLARQAGMEVACTSGSGYRHRQGHSFGGNRAVSNRLSSTYRRRSLSERNKSYALVVFTPSPWLVPLLTLHLLALIAEGLAFACIKRERRVLTEIYLGAITALWHRRRHLSDVRKTVARLRVVGARRYYSAFTWAPRKLALLRKHGVPTVN